MVQQDGTATNDCARNAAKRCLVKLRQAHPHRQGMVTDDSLSAHAPPMETLHADGLHSILGVKAGEQTSLFQQGQAAEPIGRVPAYERHDPATGLVPRVRLVNAMPLNEAHTAIRGNFIAYWAMGAERVQHLSWVTD